jgi:hypothetical protein
VLAISLRANYSLVLTPLLSHGYFWTTLRAALSGRAVAGEPAGPWPLQLVRADLCLSGGGRGSIEGLPSILRLDESKTGFISPSGKTVEITDKKGKLKPQGFLLYLCDKLGMAPDWYNFLSGHRNCFTHQGAPYIAIEDLMVKPPAFDLIVLKANIHDFGTADPSSYFRVSEFQPVVEGIRSLGFQAQKHLIGVLS